MSPLTDTGLIYNPIEVGNPLIIQQVYCIDLNYSAWIMVSFVISLFLILNFRLRLTERFVKTLPVENKENLKKLNEYFEVHHFNQIAVSWFILFNIMMFIVHFGLQPTIEIITPLCNVLLGFPI